MRSTSWRIIGALVLLAVGCSKDLPPQAKPFPVKGKVVLADGRPLTGGVVTFRPMGDDAARRYQGWGFVKADGSFEVAAFSDPGKGGGVAPGRYKVLIGLREEGEGRGSNANLIPKQFTEESTTPLEVDVAAADNVLPPFVLK
jgi:hypothetical protein